MNGHLLWKIYSLLVLNCYAPMSKGDERIFSKSSLNIIFNFMERNLTDAGEIPEALILTRCLIIVQISLRLTPLFFVEKCRPLCNAYRQVYACKYNDRFSNTIVNLMYSFNLHIFWWMQKVMEQVNSCKWPGNQADGFYAANAGTDISEKLKIKFRLTCCRCINSLHNVFPR